MILIHFVFLFLLTKIIGIFLFFCFLSINNKQIIIGKDASRDSSFKPANSALFLPPDNLEHNEEIFDGRTNIEDATPEAIQKDAVGSLTMEEIEFEMIIKTLDKFKGNRRKTASALNISERTLYRKIKEYRK